MSSSLALPDDASLVAIGALGAWVLAFWAVLLIELLRSRRRWLLIVLTGAASTVLLCLAVLRPVLVKARTIQVRPKVAVLLDRSRRLELVADTEPRAARLPKIAQALSERLNRADLSWFGFSSGALSRPTSDQLKSGLPLSGEESDLTTALDLLEQVPGERPDAVVVVSDGRWVDPGREELVASALSHWKGVPFHAVAITSQVHPDASILNIRTTGLAVAHQPFGLKVGVGCYGGLDCRGLRLRVRELRRGSDPEELSANAVQFDGDHAQLDLSITLERAGTRVIELSLNTPAGDRIAENNVRYVTLNVMRDRVRILHVAGRPTYDVRALRMWLKGDESIDLVAFFILRTRGSNPQVFDDSELALIPFPVEELFTQHLPTFDAVILQDIDAIEYGVARHFPQLEGYVRAGGGLIVVGGPKAFGGGGYAGSAVERVLPVRIGAGEPSSDTTEFVARYTQSGKVAPILGPLRALLGEELPAFVGHNLLGVPRAGAIVLWEHPDERTVTAHTPILAVTEAGDGRTIALGVDGTHMLGLGAIGERVAGRAYGALWEGLVGWLMRDPRYEAVRVELAEPCVAGHEVKLKVTDLLGQGGDAELKLQQLGSGESPRLTKGHLAPGGGELLLPPLSAGGYALDLRLSSAPPTRFDFACEKGGEAWADSRPDLARMDALAAASKGRRVQFNQVSSLPEIHPTELLAERHTTPVLPTWLWSLAAAAAYGSHWLLRRQTGLS